MQGGITNMNNPYHDLYSIMGEATKIEPNLFIGKVKTTFPNLEIYLNDIVLDKDDLLVDKWIKDRHERLFTEYVDAHTHTTSTESAGETSHSHTTSNENRHRHEIKELIHNKLEVDDKVVLLRIHDKFIVISKVVSI